MFPDHSLKMIAEHIKDRVVIGLSVRRVVLAAEMLKPLQRASGEFPMSHIIIYRSHKDFNKSRERVDAPELFTRFKGSSSIKIILD